MNFEPLRNYIDQMPERGIYGCAIRVWKDHQPIFAHCSGEAEHGKPIRGDETYWLYSSTKVVTATAVMQLLGKGVLSLDDRVSDYLPAYRHLSVLDGDTVRPARTEMTIRHLLTMSGGLNYNYDAPVIRECIREYGSSASTVQIAEALASQPLDFDPGAHFQYSFCHDVLGAIIEVAAGERFGEYVHQNIIAPLDIENLTFHPSDQQMQRLAARYSWDKGNHPVEMDRFSMKCRMSDAYESGGAGLMGDADSYIRFIDALANGGVGKNGAQILTPGLIDLMRTDQLNEIQKRDFARRFGLKGYSYGLGVRTLIDASKSKSPKGEFGWDGAAGAWVMIDPQNHLAAFYVQHVLDCGKAYKEYHPQIRNLIYEGIQG